MALPAAGTIDYPMLDLKHHALKEEEYDWERSVKATSGSQHRPTLWVETKKHTAQWEVKKQSSEEGDAIDSQPNTANNTASTETISKVESSSPAERDSFVITSSLKENSDISVGPVESFPTDISLQLVMVKRKSGLPDPRLQGVLRGRLRLLENDSKEVMAVFGELSARLLSIHSDQDLIIVTFKTFEEIWKFSTYYSLGFLNNCMENLLLDQSFWLSSAEENDEEETGIEVCISDGYLNLMYRCLLMQEGTFFVHCPDNQIREATVIDSELKVHHKIEILTEDTEHKPTAQSVPSHNAGCSKAALEPVSPFHQWFLKTYSNSDPVDFSSEVQCKVSNTVAVGLSVAVVNYESAAPEEISFQSGDKIEIIGFFIECMQWFVGRHMATGKTGFVKTCNVKPDIPGNGLDNLEFLEEEEKVFFRKEAVYDDVNAMYLLKQLSKTDVSTIYRLDIIEEKDSAVPQEKETRKPAPICKQSIKKEWVEEALQKCHPGQKPSEVTENQEVHNSSCSMKKAESLSCGETEKASFCINQKENSNGSDVLQSLLLFLNCKGYQPCFKNLYDFSSSFLNSTFHGYTDEEELVRYLESTREAAKKANMHWALPRVCFLLGRICAKKHKFSQARVYFEEALGVIGGEFSDLFLVVAVYTNLTAIYLKQKYKEKYLPIFDKVASLLMVIPNCICSVKMESVILKYALKKAVFSKDIHTEARACFLLVKLYSHLKQHEEALPFIERLQVLNNGLRSCNRVWSVDCYFKLSNVYTRKCLPHIALSCIKVASRRPGTFMDGMKRIDFILSNAAKLYGLRKPGQVFPAQIAPYLRQALSLANTDEEKKVCSILYASLSELYARHKEYKKAIHFMMKAVDTNTSGDLNEVGNVLVSLAWLYILDGESKMAMNIFSAFLESEKKTSRYSGVIYNMSAIALRRIYETKKAAEHYYKALNISKEMGVMCNQAAALANFGILCLHAQAYSLAEHYFVQSVKHFCGLPSKEISSDFIQVLLLLGHYYINGSSKEKGRLYYEWALLVAIEANNFESQLQVLQLLCQFYRTVATDEAQCIIYNKYQLFLVRRMSDKLFESQILETISHLYLSLGTERAYRSALEYTKRSLGIFIDLQQKDKEAYAWLQAGKIYHVLGQRELVDLYIQVAQDAALCTGDPTLEMDLFESAGDIFANGTREQEKAVSFYRDRALPLAVKTGNEGAELRLCNKVVELLLNLKVYGETLDYAKTSLALSVNSGNLLNERIAYHRLATIYHHLGQCELAEHYYLKALSLCPSLLEFDEEAVYYMKVYLILGDITFYDLKDPFDAAGYYHLALAAALDVGNKKAQLKIYTKLAIIYHNFLVDREMSLFFYKKARIFASELNVRRINLSAEQYYQTTAWLPYNTLM